LCCWSLLLPGLLVPVRNLVAADSAEDGVVPG
jgi:hypothetical protein